MNRKFKDFSPRALLWLEVNLQECEGAGSRDQERKTPSIPGNNALKALEKQWELERFCRQGKNFHLFFSHNSSFHPLASPVSFIPEQRHRAGWSTGLDFALCFQSCWEVNAAH